MCRPVLCQPVSCRNRLVLNGKCTSHRIHVKLNVYVTFEGTSHWMYVTLNVRHLKCTAESRELAFSASPSAFYLQDLNTRVHYTRRGAYTGDFCANGRFSLPVLPLVDCRPPLLVRVALDGGVYCQLLREQQMIVPRRSLPTLASKRRNREDNGWLLTHDISSKMVGSGDLAFSACLCTSN